MEKNLNCETISTHQLKAHLARLLAHLVCNCSFVRFLLDWIGLGQSGTKCGVHFILVWIGDWGGELVQLIQLFVAHPNLQIDVFFYGEPDD